MKAGTVIAILGKRLGVDAAGLDDVAADHPTLGDVDSAETLATYQAGKRAQKAELRAPPRADRRRAGHGRTGHAADTERPRSESGVVGGGSGARQAPGTSQGRWSRSSIAGTRVHARSAAPPRRRGPGRG